MYDFLYEGKGKKVIEDIYYLPPKRFEHGKKYLVAKITSEKSDGFDVKIYETRLPASFFTIEAENANKKFVISTGSANMEFVRQIFKIAKLISAGMLVVDSFEENKQ